jgi:two-component system response regulator AtoC
MNILIVDDDLTQLETLRRGLRSKGYNVLEASNGKEALNLFEDTKTDQIHLILADYVMPEMNGLELLKKIREKSNSLPVIIMTAYVENNLLVNVMRLNCTSVIEKPFTLHKLNCEIQKCLNIS